VLSTLEAGERLCARAHRPRATLKMSAMAAAERLHRRGGKAGAPSLLSAMEAGDRLCQKDSRRPVSPPVHFSDHFYPEGNVVRPGALVSVRHEDGRVQTFWFAHGSSDRPPNDHKALRPSQPLYELLLDRAAGDDVVFETRTSAVTYRILSVGRML